MWLRFLINFEKDTGGSITFMNKTVNLCKMLSNKRYEPLRRVVYDSIYDVSPTIVRRCHIQKVR